MSLTFGSLFAGIGGFDLALGRCGMRPLWQVEIDRFARRVLAKHWPEVTRYEDITKVEPSELQPVDLVCGGWPCQGNSVAGKRQGHTDERSGLFGEILRIIDGMAPRPRWLLLENVPGLVSVSGGGDFRAVIGELRGRGYVGCVRMLDAQYLGLAQRRQRLLFVAGIGDRGRRAIQLVLEGGRRYPAPCRETGQGATEGVGDCFKRRGGFGWSQTRHVTPTLEANGGGPLDEGRGIPLIPTTARCKATGSNPQRYDGGSETFVAHTLRGVESDASEDGTGRGTPLVVQAGRSGLGATEGATYTLEGGNRQAIAFTERTRAGGRTLETQDELAYALTNPGSGGRTHSRQGLAGCAVRRLTPTECERLMGFSWRDEAGEWQDGHTCLCGRNRGRSHGEEPCKCADGPRYRALGNAVAIPVSEWIGRRILAAEEEV